LEAAQEIFVALIENTLVLGGLKEASNLAQQAKQHFFGMHVKHVALV